MLLGGNVHTLLSWTERLGVRKLHEHHLGAPQVLAHGYDQHALTDLLLRGDVGARGISPAHPPRDEGSDQQRGHCAHSCQSSRFEPRLPPPRRPLRQARRNLLPYMPAIVVTRVGHRQGIQRCKHSFDAFKLRPAFFASRQVLRDDSVLGSHSFAVSNQFFFRHVFHDSVPIALACVPLPTKGCKARRNFCTARKTVFFAAPELDFKTCAISSMAQPSQCRMTNAVLSECESAASAISMCFRSSMFCVNRSGVGAASCTKVTGSFSVPSSWTVGSTLRASSFLRCRMRSIA